MRTIIVSALLVLVVAGCSSDLSRRGAAMELRDHFSIADPTLADSGFNADNILIQEILKPSETIRNVRFRIVWGEDTTVIHNVFFTRSDEGWAVTSYGPSAIHLVASIVRDYRYEIYSDLLPFLGYLSRLVSHWSVDRIGEDPGDMSTRELLASTNRLFYRLDHAPPRAELEGLIDPDSLPDRVSWGVYPDDEPVLVWVRDAENPDRICAEPQDDDRAHFYAGEFRWIDADDYNQCTGDVAGYTTEMRAALVATIIANGAIWLD